MLGNGEVLRELTEIRKALKAEEGYYVYTSTSHTTTLENLLKEYPLRYIKNDTLMADLYEYIINCRDHQWKELRERIAQSGFKAYCSNIRLPISGTIGTINAIVEKAQVYGYDNVAADWKAIYETDNALHMRLHADAVGLLKTADLDLDASKRLGVRFETDNIGLALETTLQAVRDKFGNDYQQLIEADETVAQSITLNSDKPNKSVFASATTATDFTLEASNDK
jgi:hypothetical protein